MHTRVRTDILENQRLEDLALTVTMILWNGCDCKKDEEVISVWGRSFRLKELEAIASKEYESATHVCPMCVVQWPRKTKKLT